MRKPAAQTFATLTPLIAIVLMGAAFLLLYEAVVSTQYDFLAIGAFLSSPAGLLLGYLTVLALFFYLRPELPWAELE